MYNPFIENTTDDKDEIALVKSATSGNRDALDLLIKRHQGWIYNITVRMVFDPEEAKDISQEILIRIITKLGSFKGESSLRTWIYRITCNYIINMKSSSRENSDVSSFSDYGRAIENAPDLDFPDTRQSGVDVGILIEELLADCLMGMLVCLDRTHRLAFILGANFGINDKIASEMMNISRGNFRKKLSRARKSIKEFMEGRCGHIDQNNPCQCSLKVRACVESGYIDPINRRFTGTYLAKIKEILPLVRTSMAELYDDKIVELFREQPFMSPPDFASSLLKSFSISDIDNIFIASGLPHD